MYGKDFIEEMLREGKAENVNILHLLADANDYNCAKYKAIKVYKDSGMQVREALKEIFGEKLFKGL